MLNTILAKKGKMGQTFVEGRRVTVTKVVAGPCVVTQVKNEGKDGYWAVQIGFGVKRIKNTTKQMQGHFKKITKDNHTPRYLAEIRFKDDPKLSVGDQIKSSDIFRLGDIISVSGISKGKGFQGVVKRWHFAGGPRTHGQSDRERAPGSIGQTTTPGRVYKGKHMAGRMGGERKTIKNLQVVSFNSETGEMEISGPVPGIIGGLLTIRKLAEGKLEGIHEIKAEIVEGEPETEPSSANPPAQAGVAEGQGKVEETNKEVKKEAEDVKS
jgi:large subunit ribosomal protein L3